MAKSLLLALFLCFSLTASAQVYHTISADSFSARFGSALKLINTEQCPDTIRCMVLSWRPILYANGSWDVVADSCYYIRTDRWSKVVRISNGTMIPQDRILLIK